MVPLGKPAGGHFERLEAQSGDWGPNSVSTSDTHAALAKPFPFSEPQFPRL